MLKKILYKSLSGIVKKKESLKNKYAELQSQNANIGKENEKLKKSLQETVALYDTTKDICKYLEQNLVFEAFKEQAEKYIELSDCQFLKEEADISAYKDYTVFPLKINKTKIGYLAAEGIRQEEKEKFHILTYQFLLGVKRAFLYQRIQELAIIDSLTEVLSRRYWSERFNEEIQRSQKFKLNLACLMLDIDFFKNYNDRYGHLVGDAILKGIAKSIKENIREIDIIGRYGGEEFSVILTETTKDVARFAAERIRSAVVNKQLRAYDEELKITVSIGISVFPDDAKDLAGLVEKADQALYQAKKSGRNRVCVFGSS